MPETFQPIVFFIIVLFTVIVGHELSRYTNDRKIDSRRRKRQRKAERIRTIRENTRLQMDAKSNPEKNFDNRLSSFLQCVETRELEEDSSAEYWESPDLEIGPDRPRSLKLIRYLLGKIYKALYRPNQVKSR